MINCLVVDDEPLACQILESYIANTAELTWVGSCSNTFEAFAQMAACPVDLIFLDIQLPALTGIEFVRQLKQPPAFVFTTAYPDYAVESYELEAVDYLLKPITYARFSRCIDKYLKRTTTTTAVPAHSYFKVDGQLVKLLHADILYAQSVKDYMLVKTPHRTYIIHMTMKALCEWLPASQFRRVHRSFLVNMAHITVLGRQDIQLTGGIIIPVGERYRMVFDAFPFR